MIQSGGEDFKKTLRAGCLAVSSEGRPHLLYSVLAKLKGTTWLATPDGSGKWRRTCLNDHLPDEWKSLNLIMAGGLSFDTKGRLHGVATLQTGDQKHKIWGDSTNEVVVFTIADDTEIRFRPISKFDSKTSHWLPNIERATGHNQVPQEPEILYTGGPAGSNNFELMKNRVYFAR